MFRAQQNAFDDSIGTLATTHAAGSIADYLLAKATDENLTSENWELILVSTFKVEPATSRSLYQDVCDRVTAQDSGYDRLSTSESKRELTNDSDTVPRMQWLH